MKFFFGPDITIIITYELKTWKVLKLSLENAYLVASIDELKTWKVLKYNSVAQ